MKTEGKSELDAPTSFRTQLLAMWGYQIVLSSASGGIGCVCDRTIASYLAMVPSISRPSWGRHQFEDTVVYVRVDFYLPGGQSGQVGFEFETPFSSDVLFGLAKVDIILGFPEI